MSESITLQTPIKRGETLIASVIITDTMKQAGSLRGLKLIDVMNSDVDSLITLLPRVTEPALTPVEVAGMDTWDFAQMALGVSAFLQPSSPESKKPAGESKSK
ncbi:MULTISPECIES: phage tail assembly protein [unclassified Serratia (in: enterobacteria)]|uniref:phage tail assembly protein n=1 Tax=unclassified Serratia (in: enterobacteria) TaxID=2647522 RepID=UPI0030764DAE